MLFLSRRPLSVALFFVALLATPTFASPLPPTQLVNKIALTLTGKPASESEIVAFRTLVQASPAQFMKYYENLVQSYLKRKEYADVMERQHAFWWHLPGGSSAKHAGFVVSSDSPYREIFVRDYIFVDASSAANYSAFDIKTTGGMPTDPGVFQKVFLNPDEKRFRGLFGTPEFLATYPDTLSNKNRKRSSQAFRIGFCEALANIKDEPGKLHERNLGLRFDDDDHGHNPDCIGCHRRLDPMARFFDQWLPPRIDGALPEYDGSRPSAGTVFLGGRNGMTRGIAGIADADLGAIVVAQPEFNRCVAKLAWQFIFGSDVPLDAESADSLTKLFSESGRFNTVVFNALLHPYFWSDEEPPPLGYEYVKEQFRDCGGCHVYSAKVPFDPDKYPFATDRKENFQLIKRIWGALNHSPGLRPMPEAPRPKLEPEQLDVLRSWIAQGAHDEGGNRSLLDSEIEEIFE